MNKKRNLFGLLILSLLLWLPGCAKKIAAADLMTGINAQEVQNRPADNAFQAATTEFAFSLFKQVAGEKENMLISPLSLLFSMAMTANGADGETLLEMEQVLGNGMKIELLNEYLHTYMKKLPSSSNCRLKLSNSIWFKESNDFAPSKPFLQKNADYYQAEAYLSGFDGQTLLDINHWISARTDGRIEKLINEIEKDDVCFLINALMFDAKWMKIYKKTDITDGEFTNADGSVSDVSMMSSSEGILLKDENTVGFLKDYEGNNYSFLALLPEEGCSAYSYAMSLTGEKFQQILKDASHEEVRAVLPKFSAKNQLHLKEALCNLSMKLPFSRTGADFSRMSESGESLFYIGDVMQNTYVSVDSQGTKAGAASAVKMKTKSAPGGILIYLNRPFVYAIVDKETGLLLFLGIQNEIK